MANRIALNRVPGESDIGHQRDDAAIARIEVGVKYPHRIKGVIKAGALAP
jgi:hypothetical protein